MFNIINNKKTKSIKPNGRPKILYRTDIIKIKRFLASKIKQENIITSTIIKKELNLPGSLRTIRRELNRLGSIFILEIKYCT